MEASPASSKARQFDVFLSYSRADADWVLRLKESLEGHGLAVWLDREQIRPGDAFVSALEEGIPGSSVVALVVSPESVRSGWVRKEYHLALTAQVRLIPVILSDAEVSGFLTTLQNVDFRDERQFDRKVEELRWGITGERPEPGNELPNAAGEEAARIRASASTARIWPHYELMSVTVKSGEMSGYRMAAISLLLLGVFGAAVMKSAAAESFLPAPIRDHGFRMMLNCGGTGLAALVLLILLGTKILNMALVFSLSRALLLLGLVNFSCGALGALPMEYTWAYRLLLAALVVAAFIFLFVGGTIQYYWHMRSLGDVACEAAIALTFAGLMIPSFQMIAG